MPHIRRVDILEGTEYLVHEVAEMLVRQRLIASDDLVQIGVHQLRDLIPDTRSHACKLSCCANRRHSAGTTGGTHTSLKSVIAAGGWMSTKAMICTGQVRIHAIMHTRRSQNTEQHAERAVT